MCGINGREITKYTVIHGVCIRSWQTYARVMKHTLGQNELIYTLICERDELERGGRGGRRTVCSCACSLLLLNALFKMLLLLAVMHCCVSFHHLLEMCCDVNHSAHSTHSKCTLHANSKARVEATVGSA